LGKVEALAPTTQHPKHKSPITNVDRPDKGRDVVLILLGGLKDPSRVDSEMIHTRTQSRDSVEVGRGKDAKRGLEGQPKQTEGDWDQMGRARWIRMWIPSRRGSKLRADSSRLAPTSPKLRDPKLRPHFHGHNPSSSTVLTSDESANHTLAHVPSLERDAASKSPTAWTYASLRTSKSVSRSVRRPGSASSSQGGGAVGFVGPDGAPLPPVKRSSSSGKPAFSVRTRVMSPNRTPIITNKESGNGDQEIEISSPPVDATESSTLVEPSSPKSFGDRIGSLLWKRKGSLREYSGPHSPSSGSFAFNTTAGRRPSVGLGEGNSLSVIHPPLRTTASRIKERHPLDHHYEMDTIHSTADNMMDGGWAATTFEETGNVDEDGIVVLDEWSGGGESERTSPGFSQHSPPSEGQGLSRNV
ncbi:5101_t:CDS:2, partial [Acaulospora colombiana]